MPITNSERRQFWTVEGSLRQEDCREVMDIHSGRLRDSGAGADLVQIALRSMEIGSYVSERLPSLPEEGNTKETAKFQDEMWALNQLVNGRWLAARRRYGPSRMDCPSCGRPKCLLGGADLVVVERNNRLVTTYEFEPNETPRLASGPFI